MDERGSTWEPSVSIQALELYSRRVGRERLSAGAIAALDATVFRDRRAIRNVLPGCQPVINRAPVWSGL